MPIQGIDLELVETRNPSAAEPGLVIPNCVRINGTKVELAHETTIQISEITGNELVTATLTMVVRSLSIRSEVSDA
jgi:hypothetical protein